MFRVIEDWWFNLQAGPWRTAYCGLSWSASFDCKTWADISNRYRLNTPWDVKDRHIWFRHIYMAWKQGCVTTASIIVLRLVNMAAKTTSEPKKRCSLPNVNLFDSFDIIYNSHPILKKKQQIQMLPTKVDCCIKSESAIRFILPCSNNWLIPPGLWDGLLLTNLSSCFIQSVSMDWRDDNCFLCARMDPSICCLFDQQTNKWIKESHFQDNHISSYTTIMLIWEPTWDFLSLFSLLMPAVSVFWLGRHNYTMVATF